MDKLVKVSQLAVDHRSDAVAEEEHRAFMDGPRWVYARRDRDLHSYGSGAVGDDEAQRTGDLGRESVGPRLKAFLRKLVGRRDG